MSLQEQDARYGPATTAFGGTRVSTQTIFGQVMMLVGLAIGFAALGAVVGKDLPHKTASLLGFVAIGMLFAQSFSAKLRLGRIGITWLLAIGLVLGLSLGPILAHYASTDPSTITAAAGGTALITLIMGSAGLATSKDLAAWMRPLSYAMLALFAISLIGLFFFSGLVANPIFSIVVVVIASGLLVVDFNYVRRHADEDDVVWLATGIFVSIVNIFISLLNLFSGR